MADDDDICDKSFESIVVKDEDILDSSLDHLQSGHFSKDSSL